jgi:hypothetical protein
MNKQVSDNRIITHIPNIGVCMIFFALVYFSVCSSIIAQNKHIQITPFEERSLKISGNRVFQSSEYFFASLQITYSNLLREVIETSKTTIVKLVTPIKSKLIKVNGCFKGNQTVGKFYDGTRRQ